MFPWSLRCLLRDLPDLPWVGKGGLGRVPVPVESVAGRQHSRPHGVDEGIDVEGYEVILLDEDALDRLDQPIPFVQVGAGLMSGPQLLDWPLADERCGCIAHSVDSNNGLRAPG